MSRSAAGNALAALVALVVTALLAEGVLRLVLPPRDRFYVNAPGTHQTASISPAVVRGVDSVVDYHINSAGIRGPAFGSDAGEYRILTVGGSTTECLLLNDDQAWPALLASALPRTGDGRHAWVGSVGRSAMTSREHVLHLKYLLRQYPRIDAVVVLTGVNDMLSALRQGDEYLMPRPITDRIAERADMRRAFVVAPHMDELPVDSVPLPWYKRTALYDVARRARLARSARGTFDIDPQGGLVMARRKRSVTTLTDTLPPLALPLAEFRRNLEAMTRIAFARHVRLIFVTQSSAWRANMSAAEQRDLWLGWQGAGWQEATQYFSPAALDNAMVSYNAELRRLCARRSVECVDAASVIPKSAANFYDDVHFTRAGAHALAAVLAGALAKEPPFVQ
ncbi:MAG: hypothetical protein ABIY52_02025 [Gemmatimonadaceae bacterium]